MLTKAQIIALLALGVALWLVAALYIRLWPAALVNPLRGAIGFAVSLPVAWLSVRLIRRTGRLGADQLLPGCAVVGAVAMMIDGAALRWFPGVYGSDPLALRLGAAWLLWGYGASLAVALAMASRLRRKAA